MVNIQLLSCMAFMGASETCVDGISAFQTNAARSRKSKSVFALTHLGPFSLAARPDLLEAKTNAFELKGNKWEVRGESGFLATTLKPDTAGRDFWQGAFEIDWAYQPKDVSSLAEDAGSFEKYGGFVLKSQDGSVQRLLEINPYKENPEMIVNFDNPHIIAAQDWKACTNPADITIQVFADKGAQQYCWHVDTHKCANGCFYYKTVEGFQAFAVKGFALESLGPFPLSSRKDLVGGTGNFGFADPFWGYGRMDGVLSSQGVVQSQANWGAAKIAWAFQAGTGFEAAPVDPTGSFEKYGGFLVINASSKVQKVLEIDFATENPEMTLHFSPPFHVPAKMWDDASKGGLSADVTIDFFKQAGAQRYTWFVDSATRCKEGCFLYKTDIGYVGFEVVQEFAISKLGPFPLFARDDLLPSITFNRKKKSWKLAGSAHTGRIAETKVFNKSEAVKFWLGQNHVDWMYQSNQPKSNSMVPTPGSFEMFGGFLVRSTGSNKKMGRKILEIGAPTSTSLMTMSFSDPFRIDASIWKTCTNPAQITIGSLWEAGAREYCWEVDYERCVRGCFVYKTTAGYQAFAVV